MTAASLYNALLKLGDLFPDYDPGQYYRKKRRQKNRVSRLKKRVKSRRKRKRIYKQND